VLEDSQRADETTTATSAKMAADGSRSTGSEGSDGPTLRPPPFRGVTCPPYDRNIEALQIPLKHLPRKKATSVGQKYDRRAHNCASHGIWNRVTIDDHRLILNIITHLAGIKDNAFVLDWGSGCGHALEWLTKDKGITGLGIDVSNLTIAYARANTTRRNMHCVADGTRLEWLATSTFDHAFSFGSIYHVYNRTLFCHVLRQLLRIVKVGGTVYNGWTENAEFKRAHVEMCFADLPVKVEIIEESKAFAKVAVFPLKAQQVDINTYSLVVTKTKEVPKKQEGSTFSLEGCPIRCNTHVCVKRGDPLPPPPGHK
jgi:ubiquinone/menaquinone biosynthesis C-methylase UbiE